MHTAVEACDQAASGRWHGSTQLEEPAPSVHIAVGISHGGLGWHPLVLEATEGGLATSVVSGLWWEGQEVMSREGLRWLVSVNANSCRTKASDICRGLWWPCWPLDSLLVKSARFVCREVTIYQDDSDYVAALGSPCVLLCF